MLLHSSYFRRCACLRIDGTITQTRFGLASSTGRSGESTGAGLKFSFMGDLYERDFYRWATEQAGVMRSRRFELEALGVDWVNVAEELDTLGRSEKRQLRSRLGVLLLDLLKWLHQPMHQGTSWRRTIETQREAIGELLSDNPSLKPLLDQTMQAAYRSARRDAVADTGLSDRVFSSDCPWTTTQVLDPNFLP